MRILLAFLFASAFSFGQDEHYSLYFESSEAQGLEKLRVIPERFYDAFKLVENDFNGMRVAAGDELKVDASGVYIEKNRILSISREEIRENSQYEVKNGWLHGVIEGDSVQVALDGELYYFLMPVKTYLFEAMDDLNSIFATGNSGQFLVLSESENEFYTTLIIEFGGAGVELKELNYQCDAFNPEKMEESSVESNNGHDTFFIEPTKEEWKMIISCHQVYDRYSK